jgi:hypothetical protein
MRSIGSLLRCPVIALRNLAGKSLGRAALEVYRVNYPGRRPMGPDAVIVRMRSGRPERVRLADTRGL